MSYDDHSQSTTPPEAGPAESPAEGAGGRPGATGHVRKYSLKNSSPILVKGKDESLKANGIGKLKVKIASCRCRSAWCPLCWVLTFMKIIIGYLSAMRWDRVRHITLTIDRKHFESLTEARSLFNAGEFIARLTRGKKRRVGFSRYVGWEYEPIKWLNYVWFMEFHKDGTCHFHILVEVEKSGKEGMIGQDRIHYYWPWGRIHERPFRSERKWKEFYGYMAKHGYMSGDKGHQAKLPKELETDKHMIIRRWGHNEFKEKEDKTELENFQECVRYFERMGSKANKGTSEPDSEPDEALKRSRKNRTYEEIQASCGNETFFKTQIGMVRYSGILEVPFREAKKTFPGEYVEGLGYIVEIDRNEFFGNLGRRVYVRKAYDPEACMEWIDRRSPWLDRKKKQDEMPPLWADLKAKTRLN